MLEANPDLDLQTLLGHILPLAKVAYVLLPCGQTEAVVHRAIQWALGSNYTVGVKALRYTVETTELTAQPGACTQPVLKVTVQAMTRGTRQTWCVHELHDFMGKTLYDHKLKYDFKYEAVGGRDGRSSYRIGRIEGGKFRLAKDLSAEWKSSVKLKDLLGWGISRQQRQLFLAQQLGTPQLPDAGAHNWVVCCGARAERIDSTDRAGARSFPKSKYLNLLKSELCLPHETFGGTPQCPQCKACLDHKFAWVKTKMPPEECLQCPGCLAGTFANTTVDRLASQDIVPDCNVDPDPQWVLNGEHKCYVF